MMGRRGIRVIIAGRKMKVIGGAMALVGEREEKQEWVRQWLGWLA